MDHTDLDENAVDTEVLDSLGDTVDNYRSPAVEVPTVTWDDVGGLEKAKQVLHETLQYPLDHPETFLKLNTCSKGVLFYGPSGTGKTMLVKAIANECNTRLVSITGPELLIMWLGDPEANVRNVFAKARAAAPCIMFFDDLDCIVTPHGGSSGSVGDSILNEIFTEMDNIVDNQNVLIIGATNRPDLVDPAFLHPGRLDQLIYIPLPDESSRLAILKVALKKSTISPDVDLASLAKDTPGFSGSDLNEICQRAAKLAMRETIDADIDNLNRHAREHKGADAGIEEDKEGSFPLIERRHFEEAMVYARRSVSDQDIRLYETFAQNLQHLRRNNSKFPKGGTPTTGFSEEASDDDYNNLYSE